MLYFKNRLFFAQRIGGLESAYIGNCPLARRLCFTHGGFFEIFLEIEIFYLSLMEAFPRKAKMPVFLAISRYCDIFKTLWQNQLLLWIQIFAYICVTRCAPFIFSQEKCHHVASVFLLAENCFYYLGFLFLLLIYLFT